jgi:tetratricopeptide (TPR) repeat protein
MGVEDRINIGRTEEEYFKTLRDRVIECVCREIKSAEEVTFHGVDMIKRCARGFLDEGGADQYQFSGEHEYYKHVLERVYRPLIELGLMSEYENNNFVIPVDSRLREICREYIVKGHIEWDSESVQYYDKVLAVDPNHVEALNFKGLALEALGQDEEAIGYYDKVLAIDPNNVVALQNKRLTIDRLG